MNDELPSERRARFDRRLHDLTDIETGPYGPRRVRLYAFWRILDYTHDEAMDKIAAWQEKILAEDALATATVPGVGGVG